MNGQIKVYSKALLLKQYARMAAILGISLLITFILGNLCFLGEYLFGLESVRTSLTQISQSLLYISIGLFTVLITAVSLTLLIPLQYGREIWFFENAKKNKKDVKDIFDYYAPQKSKGCIRLWFHLFARKAGWFLVYLLPAAILGVYIHYALRNGINSMLLTVLSVSLGVTALIGLAFYYVAIQRYFLAKYIFYENKNCSPSEAIKASDRLMDKKCFSTAVFKLSFFPWFLLYLLVAPAIYVYPYYKISVSFLAISLLTGVKTHNIPEKI